MADKYNKNLYFIADKIGIIWIHYLKNMTGLLR